MTEVEAAEVEAALGAVAQGHGELALLDVREHGQYGEGHPFFAVNLPYSRLELLAPARLPSPGCPLVLVDDGDGVAGRAAGRLAALGYPGVRVLRGGAAAWAAAGHTLYRGVNLPSKAFGELVEHALETPRLSATELAERQRSGANLLVLDGRTPAEFERMSIPGARSCPNAELALRIGDLVPDSDTTIVVNCAGRTRSIIGAENLRAAGLPNPVMALENGTQGWQLAGLELDRGRRPEPLPALSPAARARAHALADELTRRYALPGASREDVERWRAEGRTVYLLDVRTAEERAAGAVPGSEHAPGGQLAQATDQWIAVRGAKVVLADEHRLRACVTARWLRGMGHDAYVLEDAEQALEPGPPTPAMSSADTRPALPELPASAAAGVLVVDLAPSMRYRAGHLEGARWGCRPRLDRLDLGGRTVVLSAEDAGVAALAARDLDELGVEVLGFLPRDEAAWRTAGLPVVSTPTDPPDAECIDYLFFVHDRHEGNLDAARAYLAWETGLVDRLGAQERALLDPR